MGQPKAPEDACPTMFVKGAWPRGRRGPCGRRDSRQSRRDPKLHADNYNSQVLMGADDFSCDSRDRQAGVNHKSRADILSVTPRRFHAKPTGTPGLF